VTADLQAIMYTRGLKKVLTLTAGCPHEHDQQQDPRRLHSCRKCFRSCTATLINPHCLDFGFGIRMTGGAGLLRAKSQQGRCAASGEGSREALPKRKLRSTRSRVLRERVLLPVSPFRFSSSLPSSLFLVPREAKRSVQALSTLISPCWRSTVPRSQPVTSGSVTPVSPDNGMTTATIITTAIVFYNWRVPLSFSNRGRGWIVVSRLMRTDRRSLSRGDDDSASESRLARLAHAVSSNEKRTQPHGAAARRRMPLSAPLFRVPCRHRCASANPPPSRAPPRRRLFRRPAAPSRSVVPSRTRRRRRPVGPPYPLPLPPPGVPGARVRSPSPLPFPCHPPIAISPLLISYVCIRRGLGSEGLSPL